MTLEEMVRWDGRISLEEYQRRLEIKHKLERRITRVNLQRYDEEDSMSVFDEDEHDDPRYIKHLTKHQKLMKKMKELTIQLNELEV